MGFKLSLSQPCAEEASDVSNADKDTAFQTDVRKAIAPCLNPFSLRLKEMKPKG